MAITTRSQLVAAMNNRRQVPFYKTPANNGSSASFFKYGSTWSQATLPPASTLPVAIGTAQAAAQLTAAYCDRTTPGALPIPPPAPGNTWYLCGFVVQQNTTAVAFPAAVALFDRLTHCAGLVTNTSAVQPVTGVNLPPRWTDPKQVLIFADCYTVAAAAVAAVSCSYTNEQGVSGRTAQLNNGIQQANNTGLMYGPLNLQDVGVLSVESVTFPTTTATAGNYGITLARQIAVSSPPSDFQPDRLGWSETGLIDLGTSPCLFLATTGTSNNITGYIEICQG